MLTLPPSEAGRARTEEGEVKWFVQASASSYPKCPHYKRYQALLTLPHTPWSLFRINLLQSYYLILPPCSPHRWPSCALPYGLALGQEVPSVGGCSQASGTSWKLSQRPGVLLYGWCTLLREGLHTCSESTGTGKAAVTAGDTKGFILLLPEEPTPGLLSFYATSGGMEGRASHMPKGLLTLVFCKVMVNIKALSAKW